MSEKNRSTIKLLTFAKEGQTSSLFENKVVEIDTFEKFAEKFVAMMDAEGSLEPFPFEATQRQLLDHYFGPPRPPDPLRISFSRLRAAMRSAEKGSPRGLLDYWATKAPEPRWPSLDGAVPDVDCASLPSSYPGADRAYTPGTYDIQLVVR